MRLCQSAVGAGPAECAARCHHRLSRAVEVRACVRSFVRLFFGRKKLELNEKANRPVLATSASIVLLLLLLLLLLVGPSMRALIHRLSFWHGKKKVIAPNFRICSREL